MNRSPRGRGFTLVEVVVALTLVSLVMLGLVAALRTFGDTGARLEARAARADDMRLVSGLLRQLLRDASGQHPALLADGNQAPPLLGAAQSIEWLAPMPARHGAGGLHRLRLYVRPQGSGAALSLQFVPFVPAEKEVDWSAEPVTTLLDDVSSFSVQYQRLGQSAWQSDWDDPMVLPGQLRVRIVAEGGPWPELLVAVLAAEPGVDVNAPPK